MDTRMRKEKKRKEKKRGEYGATPPTIPESCAVLKNYWMARDPDWETDWGKAWKSMCMPPREKPNRFPKTPHKSCSNSHQYIAIA